MIKNFCPNKNYNKRKIKNPVYIEPKLLYENEYFLPIPREIYKGIVSKYVISNYGRVYDYINKIFINRSISDTGFVRVYLEFYRYGKIVKLEKAVDWLEKHTFDYQGFNSDEGYSIRYKDGNIQNLYIENLLYISKGRTNNQYSQMKIGEY